MGRRRSDPCSDPNAHPARALRSGGAGAEAVTATTPGCRPDRDTILRVRWRVPPCSNLNNRAARARRPVFPDAKARNTGAAESPPPRVSLVNNPAARVLPTQQRRSSTDARLEHVLNQHPQSSNHPPRGADALARPLQDGPTDMSQGAQPMLCYRHPASTTFLVLKEPTALTFQQAQPARSLIPMCYRGAMRRQTEGSTNTITWSTSPSPPLASRPLRVRQRTSCTRGSTLSARQAQ